MKDAPYTINPEPSTIDELILNHLKDIMYPRNPSAWYEKSKKPKEPLTYSWKVYNLDSCPTVEDSLEVETVATDKPKWKGYRQESWSEDALNKIPLGKKISFLVAGLDEEDLTISIKMNEDKIEILHANTVLYTIKGGAFRPSAPGTRHFNLLGANCETSNGILVVTIPYTKEPVIEPVVIKPTRKE